jgi:hypothetical protein
MTIFTCTHSRSNKKFECQTFLSMKRFICVAFILLTTPCLAQTTKRLDGEISQQEYSLASEMKIFYDLSTLPRYSDRTFSAQVSSYDTTWKNDDGFSGKYSFLKRNVDSTLLLFDAKGSGVINRIWTPTPTNDTLDFYIDEDRPTFSIRFSDLFSGKEFPFVTPLCGNQLGGFYCYLPIPFSKSCKIILRGKKIQFHQIQYKLYPEGSTVNRFSLPLNNEEREALKKIATLWNKQDRSVQDFYKEKYLKRSEQVDIPGRKSSVVFQTNEGGRIVGIAISPSEAFEGLQKDVDIKVTWDNEKYPAIFCPVADFFGYAFGSISMQSLLLGTERNTNYCYFPMPFDNSAKIELINRGLVKKSVEVTIWYSGTKRSLKEEGKFYAAWNRNINPPVRKPHTFLDIKGRGHYVATILQAQGAKAGMTIFFEGDDSTAIDGTFRMHGTGSEDYFNGGWYAMLDRWDNKMSLPLHGALDYSLPFSRTGGYRLFLTDRMSFEKSFYHSIEHGPVGNNFPVDYSSIGLYYADQSAPFSVIPTTKLTSVFLPDTLILYPQLMDFNFFGNMDVKTSWKYGTGGESYFFKGTSDSWIRILLTGIPHGSYRLLMDVQKKENGCAFSVWQRQTQISEWISTFQKEEEHVKGLYIAEVDIADFKNTITLRFKVEDKRDNLLLHRVILVSK